MRRAALAALVLALAGCGGGKDAKTTSTVSADPGKEAAVAFVTAARARDTAAVWVMLSAKSKARLGPTLARFERGPGAKLIHSVGAFTTFHVIVSERIVGAFGLVAIDGRQSGRRAVYAVPLRLEGGHWKLDLGSPVKVRPLGPQPGSRGSVIEQVAAAVNGPPGTGTAVMYLDGRTVEPQSHGTASNATLFTNFPAPLAVGRHTVVVFGTDAGEAGAAAWAFTATKA